MLRVSAAGNAYHTFMPGPHPEPPTEEDRDWLDAVPGFNRASTNLQRSMGPSCLLSLIITALILVLLRRYLRLPLPGMLLVTFAIWWAVLTVLVRLGRPTQDDDDR
jgi:hypothetical protein